MNREQLKFWNNNKYYIDYQPTIEKILDRMYGKQQDIDFVIPEYQRDYVWKENNAPALLLSLYKGFPIGNIILYKSLINKNPSYSLIDGLQRHLTIVKISEKPFNYISYKLYENWLSNKGLEKLEYTNEEWRESEAFRHFKSALHHKRTGYKPSFKKDALEFIENTKAKPFLDEEEYSALQKEKGEKKISAKDINKISFRNDLKERFVDFIKDYDEWFTKVFPKINVPHYILDEMDFKEVAEVFEVINISGVKLTKFEIASANWSRFRIKLSDTSKIIKEFNQKREEKFKKEFYNSENFSETLINYDSDEVIPSNFLYSIFYNAFKDDNEFKYTFIDQKKEFTITAKSIEPLSEVIKYILIDKYDIDENEFEFEDLGRILSENIKSSKDCNDILDEIKNVFNKLKNKVTMFVKARINGDGKYPSYPVWLLCTLAIFVIKGHTKYLDEWFMNEMFLDNRLDSSTGNTAREIIKELEFKEKPSINVKEEFMKLTLSEKFKEIKYNEKKKKIALCIIQEDSRTSASDEQIDHFLPQSKLKEYVKYIDDIWNLQYFSKQENNGKNDDLLINQWEYDVFKDRYTEQNEKEMSKLIKSLISKVELIEKKKGDEKIKEEINNIYVEIINLRREIINRKKA